MFRKNFITDLLAGLTVSFAAISLGAAFGTMSGRGAFAGMIGAAVIPIIASILGGTRLQASGPTAPMTAITALVCGYAYDNFQGDKMLAEQFITLVLLLSAVVMLIGGIMKLGRFIEMVPNVVILGFMNGIAVLIWWDQIKKLFNLNEGSPLMEGGIFNVVIAITCLALIYLFPLVLKQLKVPQKIRLFLPSALVTIVLVTVITSVFNVPVERVQLGNTVESASEFFSMIRDYFPTSAMLSWDMISEAIPFALQIALLGYLDSLLTALVIDKMTREKSKLNKEVIAQGFANAGSAIFQGIPGAQATIRSVLLIKEGAKTRMAGVMLGVFVLLGILIFKDYLALVASAVFAGVLFKAGIDVFDHDFPRLFLKHKWYNSRKRNIQLAFIIYTTLITVLIDLNVAVISGTILFYVSKKFLKAKDAESDFEQVSEEEIEYISG